MTRKNSFVEMDFWISWFGMSFLVMFVCSFISGIVMASDSPGELSAAHKELENETLCKSCHTADYDLSPDLCLACHTKLKERIDQGRGFHSNKKTNCRSCHAEHRGRDAALINLDRSSFNHDQTGFSLTGKHKNITDCSRCHKQKSFLGLSPNCSSCHDEPHGGEYGSMQCSQCHSTDGFELAKQFKHETTGFELQGVHRSLECGKCHSSKIVTLSDRCVNCHQDAHQGQLGKDCSICHKPEKWNQVSNQISHGSDFFLSGQHRTVPCEECHLKGVFKGTPKQCEICHWIRRQDDPYKTKLGLECGVCHNPLNWTPAQWDHAVQTGFRLEGRHRALACDECHKGMSLTAPTNSCYGCHTGDYNGADDPNHKQGGFPTDCFICHTTSGWGSGQFNHDTTGFSLTGAHKAASCSQCHPNGRYQGVSSECYACHRSDYESTRNPNHRNAGFSTDCATCHNTSSFGSGAFNHDTTGFPLTGMHRTVLCSQCHPNGRFQGTPSECYACHKADYESTTDPNHQSGGFPTECNSCHTTAGWQTSSFNHDSTGFPLQGAHLGLPCERCHPNGRYQGTPSDCYSCHRSNFENTRNPDHRAAGFSTDCSNCHQSTSWESGRFDHNSTGFPLRGAHAVLDCSACHADGRYQGTAQDCYTCHRQDYDSTGNPNHRAAGFPTDCTRCHQDADGTWNKGQFDHPYFPITNGAHAGFSCLDCHPNPSNFTKFTCTSCHVKDETDEKHRDAAGYQYSDAACYYCHPDGRD